LESENAERRRTENKLLRQSDILQGLAEASNQLLSGENPEISIPLALEMIGKCSWLERIFIYKNEIDKENKIRKYKSVYE